MKTAPLLTVVCFCAFVGLCITTPVSAKVDKSITGKWIVNDEATDTLQSKVRRSNPSSRSGPSGVVVGVPTPGGVGPSGPNSTLKFPIVLACEEISFEIEEDTVKASCASGVSREFLIGNVHGRTTRFRRNVLTESYSSTSRLVKHDIRVDKEGNLVAKVKIRPKGGISQTYVRVYSRPSETESQDEKAEVENTENEEITVKPEDS